MGWKQDVEGQGQNTYEVLLVQLLIELSAVDGACIAQSTASSEKVGGSSAQTTWLYLQIFEDLTKFDHEFNGTMPGANVLHIYNFVKNLIFKRWRLVLGCLGRLLVDQHALVVWGVDAEYAHDNLSVVAHDDLVDEVDSLVVDVPGHHRVFQVLQPVVDVDSLLYGVSLSSNLRNWLPLGASLVFLLSFWLNLVEFNNFFELDYFG